jgi:hypothetical protein
MIVCFCVSYGGRLADVVSLVMRDTNRWSIMQLLGDTIVSLFALVHYTRDDCITSGGVANQMDGVHTDHVVGIHAVGIFNCASSTDCFVLSLFSCCTIRRHLTHLLPCVWYVRRDGNGIIIVFVAMPSRHHHCFVLDQTMGRCSIASSLVCHTYLVMYHCLCSIHSTQIIYA